MKERKKRKVVLATAPEYHMEIWYSPPLGLAYIASGLEKAGYDVGIIDSHLNKYSIEETAKAITAKNPDAVGLTASTNNRFYAIALSRKIKEIDPDVFLVAGGPHFSVTAEDALRNVPTIDAVVMGEGEITAVELLNSYFDSRPLRDVKGICFRSSEKGRKIIRTEKRPVLMDLDSLPIPAFHLLELKRYSPLSPYLTNLTKEEKKMPAAGVISSRGCPNSCTFCANNSETLKTSFRTRNPEKFIDEVQHLKEAYGFRIFNFWDDTFTLSKKYVLDVCHEIAKRKLDIKWYARARVNTVDREMLRKMKEAGCIAILYGAESGSEKILKLIKKNITVEQIKKAVTSTVDEGMDVLIAFMISFPEEKEEDVEMTLNLLMEMHSYNERVLDSDLSPTIIYPGTVMEQIALSEGKIFPEEFSWNRKFESRKNRQLLLNPYLPIYTQNFSLEEIMAIRIKAKYRQRIKQPKLKILAKVFRFIMSIRSLEDLKTLFLIFNSVIMKRHRLGN